MKRLIFSAFAAAALISQGLIAAPALAQVYPYGYSQYPYYDSGYNYGYNYNYNYGYGYGYNYCPALSYNLVLGSSDTYTGGQVSALQRFLQSRYGNSVATTGYFDQNTYYAVAQFQREQAVYPITGGVGPLTRAAIARVCGGNNPYPYYNYPPVVTSLNGPSQLTVGQGAEWTISVRDYSGRLSYSVVWGDEGTYGAATVGSVSSSGTLAHTYLTPGTYTPRFTVTNAYGKSTTASATVTVSGGCNYYPWTCQNYPYSYPYTTPYYGY